MGETEIKIVFVRHAHRHKPHPEEDNGISNKGREQVQELQYSYESGRLPDADIFWTSPKLRCQETLRPLCDEMGSVLKVEALLDEQNADETRSDFAKRIETLLDKVQKLNRNVYLCSHGDLIPEAIDMLTGKSVDVSKGQAVVLIRGSGSSKVKWTLS